MTDFPHPIATPVSGMTHNSIKPETEETQNIGDVENMTWLFIKWLDMHNPKGKRLLASFLVPGFADVQGVAPTERSEPL